VGIALALVALILFVLVLVRVATARVFYLAYTEANENLPYLNISKLI
jgi:hypothetical protein